MIAQALSSRVSKHHRLQLGILRKSLHLVFNRVLARNGGYLIFLLRGNSSAIQNAAAVLNIRADGIIISLQLCCCGTHVLRAVEFGRVVLLLIHLHSSVHVKLPVDLRGGSRAALLVAVVQFTLLALGRDRLV